MILNSIGAMIAPLIGIGSNDTTTSTAPPGQPLSGNNVENPSLLSVGQQDPKKRRGSSDAQDIVLPNHFSNHTHIAIDIGGTLAKVVYYTPSVTEGSGGGGRLHFAKFHTSELDDCLKFLAELARNRSGGASEGEEEVGPPVAATGGGAHKFFDKLSRAVHPRSVEPLDEMACLIGGVDYFISQVPDEVFNYLPPVTPDDTDSNYAGRIQFVANPTTPEAKYPYLLVNIGSGVSIIKVTGPTKFERVSGTSLGGGTFCGLASLLTGIQSFDEILALSQRGQNRNVDMLVGDIYGQDYNKIGLKASAIASSMGKVYRKDMQNETKPKPEDICASLLFTISNNIGQIAYLNACAHKVEHIYFGGYFIRGHPVTMHTLQYAINFWSGGTINARFLRHEGYLGAMGCLLNINPSN